MLFSRWHPAEFDFEGAKLALSLYAPLMPEGRDFDRRMGAWMRGVSTQTPGDSEAADIYALYEQVYGDDWARDCFKQYVRLVGDLSIDGKAISGGAALYDELGLGEHVAILSAIASLSYLSHNVGKVFSSPSTSAVETGKTDAGGSPATSTGPEGGTVP